MRARPFWLGIKATGSGMRQAHFVRMDCRTRAGEKKRARKQEGRPFNRSETHHKSLSLYPLPRRLLEDDNATILENSRSRTGITEMRVFFISIISLRILSVLIVSRLTG